MTGLPGKRQRFPGEPVITKKKFQNILPLFIVPEIELW
jgi:hypothetical protein